MKLATLTNLTRTLIRAGSGTPFRLMLMLAGLAQVGYVPAEANAQTAGVQPEVIRQLPAPLPKLALTGAVAETKAGVQLHKIVLAITNWERYSAEMFAIPGGRKLPPNPCSEIKTRVVLAVYAERGTPLAGCIAMPKAADLGKFAFLIQKGKSVPDFVYVVINDRHTGAAYRSNLVSPWSGATK